MYYIIKIKHLIFWDERKCSICISAYFEIFLLLVLHMNRLHHEWTIHDDDGHSKSNPNIALTFVKVKQYWLSDAWRFLHFDKLFASSNIHTDVVGIYTKFL